MDGSKIDDGPAGWGAIVQYNIDEQTRTFKHCGSLENHATQYQGEIVAIILAATEILNNNGAKMQTLIFSDSQAALLAIT